MGVAAHMERLVFEMNGGGPKLSEIHSKQQDLKVRRQKSCYSYDTGKGYKIECCQSVQQERKNSLGGVMDLMRGLETEILKEHQNSPQV